MLRPGVRLLQSGWRRTAAGYSCNVTAGASGSYVGYDTTLLIGSISAEPVPGHTINGIFSYSGVFSVVGFVGDIETLLTGLHVWIDGVDKGAGDDIGYGSGWQYDGSSSTVWGANTTFGFVNGNTYLVEIK